MTKKINSIQSYHGNNTNSEPFFTWENMQKTRNTVTSKNNNYYNYTKYYTRAKAWTVVIQCRNDVLYTE